MKAVSLAFLLCVGAGVGGFVIGYAGAGAATTAATATATAAVLVG